MKRIREEPMAERREINLGAVARIMDFLGEDSDDDDNDVIVFIILYYGNCLEIVASW